MRALSANQFRTNLKSSVDNVISTHEPLRITRRQGKDFIVISAEDWDREQETMYILQNSVLMKQIAESFKTHLANKGYKPTEEELNEINSI